VRNESASRPRSPRDLFCEMSLPFIMGIRVEITAMV
jgi:hypothetical protein